MNTTAFAPHDSFWGQTKFKRRNRRRIVLKREKNSRRKEAIEGSRGESCQDSDSGGRGARRKTERREHLGRNFSNKGVLEKSSNRFGESVGKVSSYLEEIC